LDSSNRLLKMSRVIPQQARIPETLYQKITALVPIPCVDLVPVRKESGTLEILLIKRKIEPEKGKWCLIGGRVIGGREVKPERLSGAIKRQAKIELGVEVKIISPWDANHPAVLFDEPSCDPAKYPIIAVYPVEVVKNSVIKVGPESSKTKWFEYDDLPPVMGFTSREEVGAVVGALKRAGWF